MWARCRRIHDWNFSKCGSGEDQRGLSRHGAEGSKLELAGGAGGIQRGLFAVFEAFDFFPLQQFGIERFVREISAGFPF